MEAHIERYTQQNHGRTMLQQTLHREAGFIALKLCDVHVYVTMLD